MGLLDEFKAFVMRGNVVDMAVGVIMGGAFSKIVGALTDNVLMPPIGYLIGGVNFSELKHELPAIEVAGKALEPATIKYGAFLQATFDFILIAACMFAIIKLMNTINRKPAAVPTAPPGPTPEIKLLSEIRDILKEG